MSAFEPIGLMEPMLPSEGKYPELENLAVEFLTLSSGAFAALPPASATQLAHLVRSINCYYSNFIEDHKTHPRDIDRALKEDFSNNKEKRDLQKEAKAHIEVQRLIDANPPTTKHTETVMWIHKEFYDRLPPDLKWVENNQTQKKFPVEAGKIRTTDVVVGRHIPPLHQNLESFLRRFDEAYPFSRLNKIQQVIAIAASHHRLLWIHPFLDGNGRVARLFSHALFVNLNPHNQLWSISRGLARSVKDYKSMLDLADHPRNNDVDGRGTPTESGLVHFCEFFLKTALDQIEFMKKLIEPKEMLSRIHVYVQEEIHMKRLLKGSYEIIKHATLLGEINRSDLRKITGYQERQARLVLSKLLHSELLISKTPKARTLQLNFPIDVVSRWFPNLFPLE